MDYGFSPIKLSAVVSLYRSIMWTEEGQPRSMESLYRRKA